MTDIAFFHMARSLTVSDVASLCGARLELNGGNADALVSGFASADRCGAGDLAFVEGRRNRHLLDGMTAAAVLVSDELLAHVPSGVVALVVKQPHWAFAQAGRALYPSAVRPEPVTGENGISSRAFVHAQAVLEPGVIVEAGAVIGAGAQIGSGTIIGPGAVVGPGCRIGRDCFVGPNASLIAALVGNRVIMHPGVRIGQDGFGYIPGPAGMEKVPQLGRVVVQDDVEIGANTTIDRGALGDTVIGEGTKIDNLVQVGHNVKIGRCCAIAAQCGISGSVTIGNYVMLGGRAAIADHLTLGDGAQLGAASGLMHDLPAGDKWVGAPAMPAKRFFRQIAALKALSEGPRKKDGDDE